MDKVTKNKRGPELVTSRSSRVKQKQKKKLNLIRPTERLKFQFIKDFYKNKLEFELSKVHTKNHLMSLATKFLTLVC